MATTKGPGEAEVHDGSDLRVAIVHGRWNTRVVSALVEGAKKTLGEAGVKEENIVVQSVPGSYELPLAVQRIYSASHVQAASSSSTANPGGTSSATTDLLSSSSSDISKDPAATTTTAASSSTTQQQQQQQQQTRTIPFDAVIAIGVLVKGETMHFEYIADAVSHALMRVQLDAGVPVVFGLLTVLEEAQALARAGIVPDGGDPTKAHNHGEDWGRAAVEMGVKRRGWADGRIL